MATFQPAKIQFDPDGTPRASQYDDIYFSTTDGLAESRYVFIEGNNLVAGWRDKKHFSIAETGFGSGLNFLATWQAWCNASGAPVQLHYFSIEKHPLTADQLRLALSNWPELDGLRDQLLAQYPDMVAGFHSLSFEAGAVRLTLAFADVQAALGQCQLTVDAWFLDGFAPSKNPAMWKKSVFQQLADLSAPKASLATFTAAGQVRRDLQAVGFEVSKRKGFGRKREMLIAGLGEAIDRSEPSQKARPWYAVSTHYTSDLRATVIGAGIAGAQVAWHLAERGWQVDVLEQNNDIALAASGNQLGVVAPKLTAKASLEERFYYSAFLYQTRQLAVLEAVEFNQCGVLKLAYQPREQQKMQQLLERLPGLVKALSPKQIRRSYGVDTAYAGYLMPNAGVISPRQLVAILLSHSNIRVHLQSQVADIHQHAADWEISLTHGECRSRRTPLLVLANGAQLHEFAASLSIVPARGQTSQAQLVSGELGCVLSHQGYVLPGDGDSIIFGASYTRDEVNTALRDADTRLNIKQLQRHLPGLAIKQAENSHAAIRATTPDRWPIFGPMPDQQAFEQDYVDLHLGQAYRHYPKAKYQRGLYVLGGLGSRGLTTAAYCASQLVEEIAGNGLSGEKAIRESMLPARFMVRALQRGNQAK